MNIASFITGIAVFCVAVVLILGLVNMLRAGSHHRAQNLMRARVLLQFFAILIILAVVAWRQV
jgi:hypothetical protein